MKIAICDDEIDFVHTLYQAVWDAFDCRIDTYTRPDELAARYENGETYDIVFCDIVMEPYDGIELGRIIRRYDTHTLLIYLTSNLDYAPMGYEVSAFRYLLKPLEPARLADVFHAIRTQFSSTRRLLVSVDGATLMLPCDTILYLEVCDKETAIFCENDTVYTDTALSELEAQLAQTCFFRIHRKYLINLEHVSEYDTLHLTLDHAATLPISRRRFRAFSQAMEHYVRGEQL